jgi:hypothetical protein
MDIISASQALSTVNGLNKRRRAEVPDILLKQRDSQPSVYIYNIYPVQHNRQISPHGLFIIPACADNGTPMDHTNWAPYSKPLVLPSIVFEHYDKGEGELALQYWSGKEVAQDVLGTSEGVDANDLCNWGCFVAAGEKPTQQELTEAKRRLTITMQKFLQQGDLLYSGSQTERNQLSAIHRKAASYLGQYRLWDVTPQQMISCPFCWSKIHPQSAKCASCGSIVDHAKWAQGQEGYVAPAEHKAVKK